MKILSLLIIVAILTSCSNPDTESQKDLPSAKEVKKSMAEVNKNLLQSENEDIEDYAARNGWNLVKTKSGLRYMIYKQGKGELVGEGDRVILNYELRLINNYICYSSQDDGPKEFVIGRNDEPKGLDEVVRYLKVGDGSKVIIPSHLGYGLLGDNKKVPKKAILIYDIEIIEVK